MSKVKINHSKLIKKYFEVRAYEDYSFAENDGHVDHTSLVCIQCSTGFEKRGEAITHAYENHFDTIKSDKEIAI